MSLRVRCPVFSVFIFVAKLKGFPPGSHLLVSPLPSQSCNITAPTLWGQPHVSHTPALTFIKNKVKEFIFGTEKLTCCPHFSHWKPHRQREASPGSVVKKSKETECRAREVNPLCLSVANIHRRVVFIFFQPTPVHMFPINLLLSRSSESSRLTNPVAIFLFSYSLTSRTPLTYPFLFVILLSSF